MESIELSNKRIAKNTLFLYLRMLVVMVVGLFSSRIILQVLGAADYGLYNVLRGLRNHECSEGHTVCQQTVSAAASDCDDQRPAEKRI